MMCVCDLHQHQNQNWLDQKILPELSQYLFIMSSLLLVFEAFPPDHSRYTQSQDHNCNNNHT